jgi:two-component system sensor histidine kinase NreB
VARASEMESLVDEMLENLHRLSMNLRPATLDHLGLTAALDQYVDAFSRQHKVDVQYETIGLDGERLSPEVETTLYRILQEALTNVARHARASRVDVLLKRRDDCVVAVIEDDGVGFDLAAAKQSGRLGLFGMQERAEMLDGCLTIESAVGTGTSVSVEVPCVHPDSNRR